MGQNLSATKIDIDEATETIIAAVRVEKACPLEDFYPGLFPEASKETKKELDKGLKLDYGSNRFLGDNIQSAEQFRMLVKMGLANDKRKN